MTTIHDLPEEILSVIFQDLRFDDLQQCQKVSQSWYFPAHVLLLQEVHVGDSKIKEFIDSIDQNPNDSYLNAVKKLYISSVAGSAQPPYEIQHSEEAINKLLLRFPNLQEVTIYDSLSFLNEFSDELCLKVLQHCPKLNTFEVYCTCVSDRGQLPHILWKLRKLLTVVIVSDLEDAEPPVDVMHYVTSLPRLQNILSYPCIGFNNFQQLLQVVDRLPDIREINLTVIPHEENFADKFLAEKTRDEQNKIIERLSRIKRLYLDFDLDEFLCVNTINFVKKYLTGLDIFDFCCYVNYNWTDLHKQAFCSDIVDLLFSANEFGRVRLQKMKFTDMSAIIPSITHRFSQGSRAFLLNMTKDISPLEMGSMCVTAKEQEIEIQTSSRLGLQKLASELFTTTLENIDEFTLYLNQKDNHRVDTNLYIDILRKMPSLKMVTLDIPSTIREADESAYNRNVTLPLVTKVLLQTTPNVQIDTFLDRLYYVFPNLEKLNLFCFSGTWHEDIGEFRIKLTNYTLEKLKIDMTPVKYKLKDILKKRYLTEQDFFTIAVHVGGDRLLYKVTYGLSSVCRIDDTIDLGSFTLGKDYVQVRIEIDGLQRLKAYMFHDEDENETDKEEAEDEHSSDEEEESNNDWLDEEGGNTLNNDERNDLDDGTNAYEDYEDTYDEEDCRRCTIMI